MALPEVPIKDISNQLFPPGATIYTDQASDDDSGGIHVRELGSITPLLALAPLLTEDATDDDASYLFQQGHVIHLEGKITIGSLSADDVVAELPLGYRPIREHEFACVKSDGATFARFRFKTNGEVTYLSGAAGTYFLSGIHFIDPWGKG